MSSTATTKAPLKRRVRIAPNLYRRPSDGKFEIGLTIRGRWTMKTLAARTVTEAKLELAQRRLEADAANRRGPQLRATLGSVAAAFLDSFALQVEGGERSPRTLDYYRSNLRCHIEPYFGATELALITPDDIVAFYDLLRRNGKSAYVLCAVTNVLSRIFSFAIRRGILESSPVAKLERGERPRRGQREQRIFSHTEIELLLLAAMGDAFDLIALHLYTGMRQGEILGLTWDCIDFEAGIIHVRQQLQRPGKGRPAELAPLKTAASMREIVLLPQLAAVLAARRLATIFSDPDDFVFAAGPRQPIHYSRANRLLHKAAEQAGIGHVRSHDFRHTYASHLIIDLGLDVSQVQRQLGHSKTSVTLDKYTHLFERARRFDTLRSEMAASPYAALLGASEAVGNDPHGAQS